MSLSFLVARRACRAPWAASTVVSSWSPISLGLPLIQERTMATKKAAGSTSNGRDSIGRRLGMKANHGQRVHAGSIIVRQRGQKFRPGENCGIGKDHTIFAKLTGKVHITRWEKNKKRKVVHILVDEKPAGSGQEAMA